MSTHHRRNRPSALEISFDDSPPAISDAEPTEYHQYKRSIDTVSHGYSLVVGGAQGIIPAGIIHNSVKFAPKSVLYTTTDVLLLTNKSGFRPNEGIPREKVDTIIPGEPPSRSEKPVRILNNFTFFSRERGAFAELDDLAHDGYDMAIEGVGEALTARGDQISDEDDEVDEPVLLRLSPIINASIDYEKHNECVVSPYY